MDFKQLMNLASQNKVRAKQQQDMKGVNSRHSDGKSKEGVVSQVAVQAFLAKKEMEKKKKAAEEEAARRARIEERLAQSLGTKTTESAKATKSGVTSREGQQKPSKTDVINEKQSRRISEKQKHLDQQASKKPQPSSSKQTETDRKRPSWEVDDKSGGTKSKTSVGKVHKSQKNAKKGAPLSFKDLLAAAERNRNGGAQLNSPVEHVSSAKKKESDRESIHVKKKSSEDKFTSAGQDKSIKQEKTTVTVNRDSKRPSKVVANADGVKAKPSSSSAGSRMKPDVKKTSGLLNGSKEHLTGKKSSTTSTAASSSRRKNPSIERRLLEERQRSQKRERMLLKRKRNPYMDEMDDFIDDGDVDDATDVSKYIKEIFGYDRSRFNDDNDDLSFMESSYSQIEREEHKSAKIARLEDEIEQLKELAELKKEKDKLKRKAKK